MLKAILWDNDGVLVDTEKLYFEACKKVLANVGIDLTIEQYQEYSLRQGVSVFGLAAARGFSHDAILELKKERNAIYEELLREQCEVYPGVEEVLSQLAGNFRMAIVTSSRRRHFEAIHNTRNLTRYFEFSLSQEEYAKSKPHPDPYLAAIERMALLADSCIAIEDTERGLASAKAAGLRCIVIPNNFTKDCRFAGATAVLENIRALPSCLVKLA